jgi:hypothetical protein
LNNVPAPIYVVAIQGTWRTGKSTIGNLILGLNKIFPTGDTIKAVTVGVDMVIVRRKFSDGTEGTFILLDVEGLYGGDTKHHAAMITIVVASSSVLVHVEEGKLDLQKMDGLGLVSVLRRSIGEVQMLEWPELIVVLNRMHQRQTLPDLEYFEGFLKEVPGDINSNKIREQIREDFPKQSFVSLPEDYGKSHCSTETTERKNSC